MNKIILWIAGVTDNFGHDHIKEYIPVLKNYDIKELVFSDFDFLNDNIKQYSTENLLLYISKIDDEIKKIDLDSYEEILLYGHSTGGLISILYMKYGKYCNKFNGLILNDPFIEWNQGFLINFIIEYNKHILTLLEEGNNEGLLAHLYVSHFGDAHGGQIIKRNVPGSGLMYEFENRAELIKSVRELLHDGMADEAMICFEYAERLFHELMENYRNNAENYEPEDYARARTMDAWDEDDS